FFGPEPGRSYDVAVPLCAEELLWGEDTRITRRHSWWLTVMGRLKPGVTMEQAFAYLNSISPGIFEATLPEGYDEADRKNYLGFKLSAYPAGAGVSQLRSQYEDSLWLLLGIAGLVLLIACANLANLMLARASARQREIAIRMALGASRGRLVCQLLSESLLLAASGAVLGGLMAAWLSEALVAFVSTQRNQWMLELKMDWRILTFMATLTVLTCVLFGLTPAMRATRTGPGEALKAGGRGTTAGRERFGLRRALVVTQVSLSLVLVVGALLFGRSFQKLVTQDVGLRQEGILQTYLNFNPMPVPQEQRLSFTQEMLEKVRGIPGVTGVAHVWVTPLTGSTWNHQVWMDGQSQQSRSLVWFNRVSESYFQTMDIPLLAGRNFDARDSLTAPPVAIVNEAFARRYALGPHVIGMRFWRDQTASSPSSAFEIVGLVRDSKYSSLREEEGQPTVYLPMSQDTQPSLDVTFLVRAEIPLESVSASIKQVLAAVNPRIGVDFIVYKSLIEARLQQERLMATLSAFFGGLAAVLAAIGLYGVISYMVARRRGEIGIRMALGAQTRDVLQLILREAAVLVAVGLAAGTLLALAAGRAASSLLYGLQPYDAGAMGGAVVVLGAVALLASYMPARRAARLDPISTLREE
ncbi:MAG TPA: ADOP family duplicated permease, partial [Candidatus Acidoferrales bacterium]